MGTYNALKSMEIKGKVSLLGKLLALQEKLQAGIYPQEGICSQLGTARFVIRQYFESWPEYSGDSGFPIPALGGDVYLTAYFKGTLWADTPYGNARRDLLTHCINEVQNELASYHVLMLGLQEVSRSPAPCGICAQGALMMAPRRFRNLQRLFTGWPMYTGCIDFPVPEDAGYDTLGDQYLSGCDRWSGDYGERRRNLLVYCIDQLKTGLGGYTP